jgi:hypothetical protein
MKNPNSARGVRAFRVTSTATLNSSVDATPCPSPATCFERRFRWCGQRNSVQPLTLRKGRIDYV